ncbi:MAG: CapA family protein, partial [Clostridia bacterium]|nr:CapA family protein [Clostridia bacterium]
SFFAADDFTVVNLEGVLSDRALAKSPGRKFHFIGHPSYASVLKLGSVECVNLANNHTFDYGQQGYADTKAALEKESIAFFGEDTVTVLEKEGMRIGFTGSMFALDGSRRETMDKQLNVLKRVGCQWIAHTLHGGEEYASKPTVAQRSAAQYAAGNGVSLVVGHHPHVVQGMEMLGNTPVFYSLGNCCFGGNLRPRDMDACLLRVEISFRDGQLETMRTVLYPFRISGERRTNNFQPVLLEGEDAERVMGKLGKSSSVELAPYVYGQGAVQPLVVYRGEDRRP